MTATPEILPPLPAVAGRDDRGRFAAGNPGRPPGSEAVTSREARQMILDALAMVGGAQYLAMQAVINPGPFMSLVGRVVPVKIEGDGAPSMIVIRETIVDHRKS